MKTKRSVALVHDGGMRFTATTGSGRTIVFGDAAPDGELSPVETIAVALGACTAMDVVSILVKKRQVWDVYRVEVARRPAHRVSAGLHRIDVVHVVARSVVLEAAMRRDRAVSRQVLPGQRDDLGRRDRGPPPLPDALDRAEPTEAEGEVIVTGPDRPARSRIVTGGSS